MGNMQYGGRYSNNLISDVVPPETKLQYFDDRGSATNFKSFPEIGRNFRRAYARPSIKILSISVKEIVSTSKVNVIWNYPKMVNITFVPPISSFSDIGYASNTDLELKTISENTSDLFSRFSRLITRFK